MVREPVDMVDDDELAARLRIAVTRLSRRLRQESMTGISPSHEAALATVSRLGHPTLGELAAVEQVQPPTMTRIVASMEAAGLLRRHGDADDRRVIRVAITSDGRKTLERIRTRKNAYIGRQLVRLSDGEREYAATVVSLLERFVEGG
ncbi:MAG: MarR family winged helix-turn-helix transcriptional regulator [Acidimicrobiales bacterium]